MSSKILNPGIKDTVLPKVVSQSFDATTGGVYKPGEQTVKDFAKPSRNKLVSELADKLGSTKIADKFSKLSSDIELKKINDKVVATIAGDNGSTALGALQDLPKSDISASAINQAAENNASQFKVKLEAIPSLGGDVVVFDVMPSLSENHSASYDSVDIIHHPGQILKYRGTSARSWGLTADFVSRTRAEADKNLIYLNIIRSWVMPFYGNGTADIYPDRLGAPPQVLILSAYGSKMVGPVTCVLEDFSWTFENDMDYIATSENTPFPVHIKLSLTLKETWTPAQFTSFNLDSYRRGNVGAAFSSPAASQTTPQTQTQGAISGSSRIDTSSSTSISQTAVNLGSASKNMIAGIQSVGLNRSSSYPTGSPTNNSTDAVLTPPAWVDGVIIE